MPACERTGKRIIDYHTAAEKKKYLLDLLRAHAPLAVALSGGVDSSFLLATARQALGEKVVALTSVSSLHAGRERRTAELVAGKLGARQVEVPTRRLEVEAFTNNNADRCYVCKKILWAELAEAPAAMEIFYLADGLCLDDLDEDRPGVAAGREAGILSPLVAAGLGKKEIVFLAKEAGLPVWNKPANACLATRLPRHTKITADRLAMIEAAEDFLADCGFTHCRVRYHGDLARIEVADGDIDRLTEQTMRRRIVRELCHIGFSRIAADLYGYAGGGSEII